MSTKVKSDVPTKINRRAALILPATVGVAAALGRPALASDSTKTAAHQVPGGCSTPRSAIAATQYGKVRGYVDAGVLTFKGIPYGQDTAGENRWLTAKPPNPWTGEYPALIYGANCPQRLHDYTSIEQSFLFDWDDGYMSENMLMAALQKMEWGKLNAAMAAAAAKINGPTPRTLGMGSPTGSTPRVGMGPTVDGRVITVRSFHDAAPELSKNVPMLIGSVGEEGNRMGSKPTEAEWHTTLAGVLGDSKASKLIAAMKKAHPEKSIRTLSYGVSGLMMRNNVARMATLKHKQNAAPVFAYFFTWQSPMLEDAGAWHTAELAFCFDNTKRCVQGTGDTREAEQLAKKMATAWANFARTGNPSQPGLSWTASEPGHCQTMVFDNSCQVVDDPEGEVRKILES